MKSSNKDEKVDYKKLNDVISISKKILNIMFVFIIIIAVYMLLKLGETIGIGSFFVKIFDSILPLFVGLFLAWLFEPFVTKLQNKGIKRIFGAIIVYLVFLGVIGVIIGAIIPLLGDQINDFVQSVPGIFNTIKSWVEGILDTIKSTDYVNIDNIKTTIFSMMENMGTGITQSLPESLINGVKGLFSGLGTFLLGLLIGFYFLISQSKLKDTLLSILPSKSHKDIRRLGNEINTTFRRFINGSLIDCTLIFVLSSIAFWICGVKAPLLFGLFCGITNIIPFAGPYIGGTPAVIVALSQSPTTGIFALISIVVIQMLEANFIQPLIMSKSMKLHPVTIIIGLLIFSKFFGIFGMVISTPIIGALKAVFIFFNDKYNFIDFDKN